MQITIDFSKENGRIKPMHAINNGPVHKFGSEMSVSNLKDYQALKIPYARNHDASFCAAYGGEHTVDVHAIFPDFAADVENPNSYDFACTDEYIRATACAGTETFYRLGTKIEHEIKKYNTLPPKDFHKWARICEHIIRHYNEGWANGFHYNLTYWEIWNEPNLDCGKDYESRTWGGTEEEFFELFSITATHLKKTFPHLKIGGPAHAGWEGSWSDRFLTYLTNQTPKVPLDFFSWHLYCVEPKEIEEGLFYFREKLDRFGYTETEQIMNEWNYIKGWVGEDYRNSYYTICNIKGAAFTAAMMCMGQTAPADMLMYYDARPSFYNGLWSPYVFQKLKTYYAFSAFSSLYQLGTCVEVPHTPENVYVCAAKNNTEAAVMLVYYSNKENLAPIPIDLTFANVEGKKKTVYLLDETHNLEPITQEITELKHNTVVLIKFV